MLLQDLRYGARMLLKSPGFTLIAVITLALGIGANTAIFSLVNGILLRQLPFRQPEQLVWVDSRRAATGKYSFTLPDFIDYRDQNQSLSGIAALASWSANLTDQGEPEQLQGVRISANAFDLLGVEAVAGRALLPGDDTPGQQHVVVLSYGLWRRRFGADPQLVGKKLTLNGASHTVVGVLPPQFFIPNREAELAVPLAPDADPLRGVRTSTNFLRALARLKPGVTREQAEAELTAVAQRIRRQYPVANAQKLGVTLSPLYEEVVGAFRLALWVLLGAVGMVLLIGAGLLIKSFLRLQAVNPGFEAENALAIRLSLPKAQYSNRAAVSAFYEKLWPRLESLPGVEAVGFVSALPLSGTFFSIPFTIEGREIPPDGAHRADYRVVSGGYLRTLKIPLIAGREFNERDTAETSPVALISQNLARRHWPNGNPLGARLRINDNNQGPRPVEVVGVVGDVKHLSLDGEPAPHIYLPLHQTHEDQVVWLTNSQYWLLRTTIDPLTLSAAVRREIQAVDPAAPTSNIRTMEQYLAASVAPRRFNLWLLTVFAGAALALAGTGLYGVISYGVAQRRREIGIRMALGARGSDVLKLVIGQGMALALVGVALGLLAALALTRLMKNLLFSVSATDPLTFLVIAALLTCVALLACFVPARRAAKVDPLIALRSE